MNAVPQAKRKFLGLEIGRGIAAALVAFHHAGIFITQMDGHIDPFGGVTDDFHVSVDFFFVLSGFLITWLHWSDIGNVSRLKGYLLKRFARVYPIYWCILLPMAVGELFEHRVSISYVLSSFLLTPSARRPILGVGWTLVYEIFFYLGFGALILGGRRLIWALPLWAAAILIHSAIAGLGPFPTQFFLSPLDLEFMAGIVAALILRHRSIPFPGWVLAFGLIIFFGGVFFRVETMLPIMSPQCRMIFGFSAGLIVLGVVEIDRSGRSNYPDWLVLFGTASYSIYLVHAFVEDRVLRLLERFGHPLSPDMSLIIISAFGIASGILFHVLIERRVTAWVNAAVFGRREKSLVPGAAVGEPDFAQQKIRVDESLD